MNRHPIDFLRAALPGLGYATTDADRIYAELYWRGRRVGVSPTPTVRQMRRIIADWIVRRARTPRKLRKPVHRNIGVLTSCDLTIR